MRGGEEHGDAIDNRNDIESGARTKSPMEMVPAEGKRRNKRKRGKNIRMYEHTERTTRKCDAGNGTGEEKEGH